MKSLLFLAALALPLISHAVLDAVDEDCVECAAKRKAQTLSMPVSIVELADAKVPVAKPAQKAIPIQQAPAGDEGLSVAQHLKSEGYSCESGSSGGFHCKGKIAGYSRPIHIYIPKNFQKGQVSGVAYHFHGFWTQPGFNPFSKENGDFSNYLNKSKSNSLLVVPESVGKDETFANELNSPQRMNNFFQKIEGSLKNSGVPLTISTPRAISGHSGAYVHMGRMGEWAASGSVPYLASVRGIGLLDSAYGYRPGLVKFMKVMRKNSSSLFYSAYNPNDGSAGKRNANAEIYQQLKAMGPERKINGHSDIEFIKHQIPHMSFMKNHLADFLSQSLPNSP